jgi:phospholipase C
MIRLPIPLRVLLVVVLALLDAGLLRAAAQITSGLDHVQHVVIIVKQNKSFDHFFGAFPGADGATQGTLSDGRVVNLVRANDQTPDICNQPLCNFAAIDGGKMDRYDVLPLGNQNGNFAAYSQETQEDISNYWSYAQNFVLGDHMFSATQSAGFPDQLMYIAANNGGAWDNPNNPTNENPVRWGCDSNPAQTVHVFDEIGNNYRVFPCFDFPTMMDSLSNAGLTWKFYGPTASDGGYEWLAPNAIKHIRESPLWTTNVVDQSQFVQDAKSGNLPTVSWIVPTSLYSEHPGNLPSGASTCAGENWTVAQINAIMQGPLWNSTVIFVTWDDSGGFFDHVTPPATGRFTLGVRVPLLIISPFAKNGYVTHRQYSYVSFLKFIETRFHLAPLTSLDADADPMLDAFDFGAPRPPLVLSSRSCPLLGGLNLSFGGQLVGTTSSKSGFQLFNDRDVTLSGISVSTTGNFSQTNDCPGTLAPGAKCSIRATFKPSAAGPYAGQLTVSDSDPSPQQTNLTGIGSNISVSPPGLSFSATGVGMTSAPLSLTLTNHGTGNLSIASIKTVGDFTESDTCGTALAAGASCTINLKFKPTTTDLLYGSLFISSSDPASPQQILLGGSAYQVAYDPRSLTFSPQNVGTTSPPKTVQVTNLGSVTLTFASFVASGDFAETNNCGSSIGAGGSCTISVTFTPTQLGTRTGGVTVTDSDLLNPQVIKLSGTGQ